MNIANTKFYKWLMPYLYGWGASLVILGALAKILHHPLANIMLIIGMGTEALIFFMSAFERPPKEYKWERAYHGILDAGDSDGPATVTQQLDKMLEEVNVDSKVRTHSKLVSVDDKGDGRYLVKNEIKMEIEGQEKPAYVAEALTMYVT